MSRRRPGAAPEVPAPESPTRQRWGRLCLACGAAAVALWWTLIAWAGAQLPDFNHRQQFISELGAGDSTGAWVLRVLGFGLSGALLMVCGLYIAARCRRDRAALLGSSLFIMAGAARLAAGLYPCDAGCPVFQASATQLTHVWAERASVGLLILAASSWGVAANRYPALRPISVASFGCATWTIVLLVMMVTSPDQPGLYERLANGLLSIWVILFVVSHWRAGVWRQALAWARPDYAPRRRRFR
ncbi:MAG: DUF998 domain-containing protein [Gammaproteobacteria bacterium]|nr:DUF998 domain-containing protein [Gammaproteobacteria bacterium]